MTTVWCLFGVWLWTPFWPPRSFSLASDDGCRSDLREGFYLVSDYGCHSCLRWGIYMTSEYYCHSDISGDTYMASVSASIWCRCITQLDVTWVSYTLVLFFYWTSQIRSHFHLWSAFWMSYNLASVSMLYGTQILCALWAMAWMYEINSIQIKLDAYTLYGNETRH